MTPNAPRTTSAGDIDPAEQVARTPHLPGVRLLPWTTPWWVTDGLLAMLLAFFTYIDPDAHRHGSYVPHTAALIAAVGLVVARRKYPIAATALAVGGTLLSLRHVAQPPALIGASIIVTYGMAVRLPRRWALITGAVSTAVFALAAALTLDSGSVGPNTLAFSAWSGLSIAVGSIARTNREALAAAHLRAQLAEQSRDGEAQRRVTEERLRIARDVHDLVAHHIAVINVQAGVAEHLVDTNPGAAADALGAVRSSASTVIDELGELLSVLRDPGESTDGTAPTPDLSSLRELIAGFTASGLDVRHETAGQVREISETAAVAAFRLVQEGLTNAHKHGDGSAAVSLTYSDTGLSVLISNPVSSRRDPSNVPSTGFGLVGMAERVDAVGGTLAVGPTPDGNQYHVHATFPLKARP